MDKKIPCCKNFHLSQIGSLALGAFVFLASGGCDTKQYEEAYSLSIEKYLSSPAHKPQVTAQPSAAQPAVVEADSRPVGRESQQVAVNNIESILALIHAGAAGAQEVNQQLIWSKKALKYSEKDAFIQRARTAARMRATEANFEMSQPGWSPVEQISKDVEIFTGENGFLIGSIEVTFTKDPVLTMTGRSATLTVNASGKITRVNESSPSSGGFIEKMKSLVREMSPIPYSAKVSLDFRDDTPVVTSHGHEGSNFSEELLRSIVAENVGILAKIKIVGMVEKVATTVALDSM